MVYDGRNSGLKGTYGYIDPVYISTSQFTMKSDIYSLGIIIFELITAIHPHQNLMEYVNLVSSLHSGKQIYSSGYFRCPTVLTYFHISPKAAMAPDGVDEILDKQLGECNIEEVRMLARVAHKCLHQLPRKRPSIAEVSQGILKIKQRRLAKQDTMSFAGEEFSRAVSRIEVQQVELSRIASVNERVTE